MTTLIHFLFIAQFTYMYIPPTTLLIAANAIASSGVIQNVAQSAAQSFSGLLETAADALSPKGDDTIGTNKSGSLAELDFLAPLKGLQKNSSLNISGLRQKTDQALDSIRAEVHELLSSAGIDLQQAFQITANPDGTIAVSGTHSQLAEIEKIFSSQPHLAEKINEISANLSLLKAAEDASKFQQDYAKNPKSAVDTHQNLFNEKTNAQLTLQFQNGKIKPLLSQFVSI